MCGPTVAVLIDFMKFEVSELDVLISWRGFLQGVVVPWMHFQVLPSHASRFVIRNSSMVPEIRLPEYPRLNANAFVVSVSTHFYLNLADSDDFSFPC